MNVCVGVGAVSGSTTLYVFSEPAFNTFDQTLALERSETIPLLGERLVHVSPLAEILEEHLPAGREISFLNVDVEGRDLEVLESNDWSRYRPEVVLAESPMLSSLEEIADDPVHRFLGRVGYAFLAKTINTLIFARTRSA